MDIVRQRIQRGIAIGTLTAFGCGVGGHAVASPNASIEPASYVSTETRSFNGMSRTVELTPEYIGHFMEGSAGDDAAVAASSVRSVHVSADGKVDLRDKDGRDIQMKDWFGDGFCVPLVTAGLLALGAAVVGGLAATGGFTVAGFFVSQATGTALASALAAGSALEGIVAHSIC